MKTIQYRQSKRAVPFRRRRWVRRISIAVLVFVGVCVIANAVMWVAYRNRVLPNYSLGAMPVGNISYQELGERISSSKLLPQSITLTKDTQKQEVAASVLGLEVDKQKSIAQLKRERTAFPLVSLFTQRTIPTQARIDDAKFLAAVPSLSEQFHKDPLQERVTFTEGSFTVAGAEDGYTLDAPSLKSRLRIEAERGKQAVMVPTKALKPAVGTIDLAAEKGKLQQQLASKVKLAYKGQMAEPTTTEKGTWYVPSGQTMELSPDKISAYVLAAANRFGMTPHNAADGTAAVQYALTSGQETTFTLMATATPVRYTYCTALRGVDQAHSSAFVQKIAATLADPRGWNAGGQVSFVRGSGGCSFTIWLSAPESMTSFGGLCDSYYSCRSGNNVVINFDRWQGATDPWNKAGGSLQDYRVMVINHEVGHRLGFGHATCPGPGQLAPVMMQQSISLAGCKFNPWPVAGELTTLKQSLQIAGITRGREEIALVAGSCCCGHCGRTVQS